MLGSWKQDQIQNINGYLKGTLGADSFSSSGAFGTPVIRASAGGLVSAGSGIHVNEIDFDASRVTRTGAETVPPHSAFTPVINL